MKVTFNGKPVGQWVFWVALSMWSLAFVISASVGIYSDALAFGCGIIAAYLVLRGLRLTTAP